MQEEVNLYKSLYKTRDTRLDVEEAEQFFNADKIPELQEADQAHREDPITTDECSKALAPSPREMMV